MLGNLFVCMYINNCAICYTLFQNKYQVPKVVQIYNRQISRIVLPRTTNIEYFHIFRFVNWSITRSSGPGWGKRGVEESASVPFPPYNVPVHNPTDLLLDKLWDSLALAYEHWNIFRKLPNKEQLWEIISKRFSCNCRFLSPRYLFGSNR